MNDALEQQIAKIKEVLDTLPKNNKRNVKLYKDEVSKYYSEFKNISNALNNEYENRKKKIGALVENPKIEKYKKELKKMEDEFYLLPEANSSYEKSNLDKYIYDVSKYYKYNLDKVNEDLNNITMIFVQNNIILTKDNFYYSKYIRNYMEEFYLNSKDLKALFEEIYWKCSDILVHAELNFKSLYLKNKSIFDRNIKLKKDNMDEDEVLINKYYDLKKDLDILIFSDEATIYKIFKNRVLNINEFKNDSLKQIYQNIFQKSYENIDINDVIKYYYALKEYTDYLEVSYIFEDAKKLLTSKDGYKSNEKSILKNIKKEESILKNVNKNIDRLDRKNKDDGKFIIKQNNSINKLKELYDNLSYTNLLDRLYKNIDSGKSFNEVLEAYYANYLYLVKLLKDQNEEITMDEINDKISLIKDILLSPYKTFINHILIGENKDIKMVFSDCFNLVSYNLNEDILDSSDDVNSLRENIYKIIIYYYIDKLNINVQNVEFFCNCE